MLLANIKVEVDGTLDDKKFEIILNAIENAIDDWQKELCKIEKSVSLGLE